jgi:GDPmannose 4,6-dehydratase
MITVLITGITGQDGSYLAELLLTKNYKVVGTVRSLELAQETILPSLKNKVKLVEWDMLSQFKIIEVIQKYKPSEVYNFAAYSSGAGMFDDPVSIAEVNGLAVVRILEAIRKINKEIKFCQASSREVFGDPVESPQTESTKFSPRSPYGAAKLFADSMIKIYRSRYKMFLCSAILYNHESPRRPLGFVTRKITDGAARIKLGLANELKLGNLDSLRDWGFAGDTVHAMWLMLQADKPDDYIVATGELHSVREVCESAFSYLGLNYRDYIREDTSNFRTTEETILVGNSFKCRQLLGWQPSLGFDELIKIMVDTDLQKLNAVNVI